MRRWRAEAIVTAANFDTHMSTQLERAKRYVQLQTSGGFEALESGLEAARLDPAQIETLAKLVEAAPYDPLVLGLVATPEGAPQVGRGKLARSVRSALRALARDRARTALTSAQGDALEAIVRLTGRPAILLHDNRPSSLPAAWKPRMYPLLDDIAKTAAAVGRIQLEGQDYLGTGFLVAPRTIMTNRHVAECFCKQTGSAWKLQNGITANIDFYEEFGSTKKARFSIVKILGVHPKVDLALLEMETHGALSAKPALPLKITDDDSRAADGSQVYVIGYPAADGRNDAIAQHRLFKGIYEKKRLAPGRIMTTDAKNKLFTHDCTTLGGNSGSCVIEFNTGRVVGLHFSGSYLEQNVAVLLPGLRDDPLLRKLHVPFMEDRRNN